MLTPFGKFSRKLRIDRGELLKDMANNLGVTSAYLSAVEVGKRNIPESWLDKINSMYKLASEEAENLMKAYSETLTQIKIDLNNQTPQHKEAAMIFARELKDLNENELEDFLLAFKNRKNRKKEEKSE